MLSRPCGCFTHHSPTVPNWRIAQMTTLVLRESLFSAVVEESRQSNEPTAGRVAAGGIPGATLSPADLWRRTLVSPLGTFLTGVRNKYPWVQLAGHTGSFMPGRGGTICKRVRRRARRLWGCGDAPVVCFLLPH